MVRVAFERVKLDAVQLLEALPTVLAREVVLHLGRVLLHVPVERRTLPALVAADLAPAGSGPAPGAGSGREPGLGAERSGTRQGACVPSPPEGPLRFPPSQRPRAYCRGVSPVCVRLCTSRWFFLLKDLPQVSQVNSRTPEGGDAVKQGAVGAG